jgi:hypothetical protein
MAKTFTNGEKVWVAGCEVTFVDYRHFEYAHAARSGIGAAVVKRPDEAGTREVPLWLLARDEAESVARANAVPIQLDAWNAD